MVQWAKYNQMKKTQRIIILFLGFIITSCGGGNSQSGPVPNTGNIPNLANRPTPAPVAPGDKKV